MLPVRHEIMEWKRLRVTSRRVKDDALNDYRGPQKDMAFVIEELIGLERLVKYFRQRHLHAENLVLFSGRCSASALTASTRMRVHVAGISVQIDRNTPDLPETILVIETGKI
jgi:hypothetical protein